ncbi:sensor histidine kinase [Streptomyces sp. NPDC127084]|uniref:sensor histidine kinase n=1 Tax=Streptomyces sp. NPDC127084 TaxID=3347133 RepID=UPI0036511048
MSRIEHGEQPQPPPHIALPPTEKDAFGLLEHEIRRGHAQAASALTHIAQLAQTTSDGREETFEVFVSLSRRLQSLVHRAINTLDALENEIEDPDLLKRIFIIDHLATRIRRYAENVAVLGGTVSRRQWSRPVNLTEVLRSAVAEVEQYTRVKLVPPIEGMLRGHAVADVIHLLAELVENATVFSSPGTQVLLRSYMVQSGLSLEVEDRGLGMPIEDQARFNALFAYRDHINVRRLLADGRIGLYVVSELARRHDIPVQLQSNIYGGVQAVVIIPHVLLGEEAPQASEREPDENHHLGPQTTITTLPPTPRTGRPVRLSAAPHAATSSQQAAWPASAEASLLPQHSVGAEPEINRWASTMPGADTQDDRPKLPKRRAQEHLAPELLDIPDSHVTGNYEVNSSQIFTQFKNGATLADEASG